MGPQIDHPTVDPVVDTYFITLEDRSWFIEPDLVASLPGRYTIWDCLGSLIIMRIVLQPYDRPRRNQSTATMSTVSQQTLVKEPIPRLKGTTVTTTRYQATLIKSSRSYIQSFASCSATICQIAVPPLHR